MHPPQHATPIPSFRENVTAPHLVPIKGKFSDAASEFSPKRQPTGFEGVLLSHHRSHPERHFTLRFRCHLLTPTPRAPFLLFQLTYEVLLHHLQQPTEFPRRTFDVARFGYVAARVPEHVLDVFQSDAFIVERRRQESPEGVKPVPAKNTRFLQGGFDLLVGEIFKAHRIIIRVVEDVSIARVALQMFVEGLLNGFDDGYRCPARFRFCRVHFALVHRADDIQFLLLSVVILPAKTG